MAQAELGFEAVFRQHAPYVMRVLRRFGVRDGDLQDVCQDVFVIVLRKLDEFEGRAAIRTWLYRICARTASDYRKRAHRRYEVLGAVREPSHAETQHDELTLRRNAKAVNAVLGCMGAPKRAVFVLYELEELPMSEVAKIAGCPLQTAFSRLYAARPVVSGRW